MTGHAVVGNGDVRPGERVVDVVIESRWRPGVFRVAGQAIGWKLVHLMIGAGCQVIFVGMAACASIGGIVVVAVVASRAIAHQGCVGAI